MTGFDKQENRHFKALAEMAVVAWHQPALQDIEREWLAIAGHIVKIGLSEHNAMTSFFPLPEIHPGSSLHYRVAYQAAVVRRQYFNNCFLITNTGHKQTTREVILPIVMRKNFWWS
jgi:hypothetical protein